MTSSQERGKDYLKIVTKGSDSGTANSSYQGWLSILKTYVSNNRFTSLEEIFNYRLCYELKIYGGLCQGFEFLTEWGVFVVLAIYFDKHVICDLDGAISYGVHVLVCDESDRMITLQSHSSYKDIFYSVVRSDPSDADYIISFVEWWTTLVPEGLGEVVNLIGGGCDNLASLPGTISKCTEDVKSLSQSICDISRVISVETTRIRDLVDRFAETDSDGITVVGRILSRVEDFSLLAMGLLTCVSIRTAVIMCLQYYKTFVKGPALLKIMKILTDLFGYIQGLMVEQKSLKAEALPEFEATGFICLDIVKWLSKNWKMVMEGEVIKNISNTLTILMAFICGDDKTEEFVNQSTFHLFKARAWDFSKGSKGFIDMLLSTLQFFLEKGLMVMQTGNLGSIFYSDTIWQELEIEMNNIMVWSKLIATNQLNTVAVKSEGVFSSEEDYRCRLHKLKDKFYEYHKIEKNQKNRSVVTGYLLKLGGVNVALQMQKKSASFKEAPFCIMLHGESAIAKSLLMNVIAKCVAQANGWPGDFENICSPNEADEYDTEYNDEIHTILFIDDILNTRPEWYTKPPTDRVLRVKNNSPQTVLKADVESKGLMMWLVKLLVLSTNVKSLKAHIFSNLAASIMRRIDLVVNCYLKDSFKDELGCFKNSTGEKLPSAWNFRLQQVKLFSRGEEEVNCDYSFEDIYSTDDISDLLKFVALRSRIHTLSQQNIVNDVKEMFSSGFCSHFKIKCECAQCGESATALDSNSLAAIAALEKQMISEKEKQLLASVERHMIPADKKMSAEALPEVDSCKPLEQQTFGEIFSGLYVHVNDIVGGTLKVLKENWVPISAFGVAVGLISVVRGAIAISTAAQSIVEKDPVPVEGEQQNVWVARKLKRVPLMIRRSKESASTTYTDLRQKLSRSQFSAKIFTGDNSACFNICPVEGNYWLAPYHSVNFPTPLKIMVSNCQIGETGIEVKEMLSKDDIRRIAKTDYAIIRLKCVQPRKGFFNFFPCEPICGSDMVATCVYRPRRDWFNKDLNPAREQALLSMEQSLDPSGCYTSLVQVSGRSNIDVPGHMTYQGFRYRPDHTTFNGLCGMVMILQARGAVIMGMHLAGDGQEGVVGSLTQSDIRAAIDTFPPDFLPMTGEGGITPEQYGYSFEQPSLDKEGLYDADIGPKHCLRFMDAAKPTAIEVYGPHSKGSRTLRSDVKQSLISDSVSEIMDLPRIHGKPKGIGTWRPFQENAQNMMEPCNEFDPDILERCMHDVVKHHMKVLEANDLRKHVHFVSADVAINGVSGMTGMDRIDLATSAGHPIDAAKNKLIDYEKSEIDEFGVITKVVFVGDVYESVETLKQKALQGERLYTIFRANVKDEATKLTKESLRIFAGTPLDFLILCKQALGTLNRVFQLHWEKFECCISANCYDDDWTTLFRSIWQEGCDTRFFCGDYKHWDKSLSPKILSAAAGVVYRICARCDFSEAELKTVSAILQELIYPIYEWDGLYVQFLCSMPSGVFITVLMSNICNSLLFRYTFYKTAPGNENFDDYIKANFMGDDNIGTVKPECTWWDQLVHARILGELGITYTSADKASELKPFYSKEDATYLKRKFVWDERLKQYLAPIEESSLQKPLHNYMKRKKSLESPESISGSAIEHCIREYFRMGEEIYNRRSIELLEIVKKHNLWKNCSMLKNRAAFPTYDEMCTDYLKAIELKHSQQKAEGEAAIKPHDLASMIMSSLFEERTIENVADAAESSIASTGFNLFRPEGVAEKVGVVFRENKHTTSQIVTFDDIITQNAYDVVNDGDMTFSMQDSSQDNLAGFFARPIKIYSNTIAINTAFKVTFDPWTLFFTNLRVVNRISNFNLMRCKLRLRFLINGNSFYYGRFIASYLPLAAQDEFEITVPANRFIDHVTLASQRPHVYLDPTTSQGGEMLLPFFFYNSNMSIPLQEWSQMGRIFIDTIANLQHANGGTESVTLSVFAYAEDMMLSIPTSIEPAALAPQGILEPEAKDEVELVTGRISGPSSALAKGLATMAMYPPIKPYAMAASYVAEAVSGVARLFGYSRPKLSCNPPCRYKPEFFGALTTTDVAENISCMALDSKQEVTIDPRVAGLSATDEMTVASIVAHESYFHSLTWSIANAPETCLGQIRVDPAQYRQLADAKFLTSTAFVATPFKFWTGTLNFRFQVICSGFHRGRLRIVYDPVAVSELSTEYNVNYTHVIDISETKDITVSIPPCQHRPLMESATVLVPTSTLYTNGAALAAATLKSNGVLSVYVVNDLTIPSITAADVTIAVFISAKDDFAVWNPQDSVLGSMVLEPQGVLEPEGLEEGNTAVDTNVPIAENPVDMIQAPSASMFDALSMIYTGENAPSIRSWLKRYCHHFSWGGPGTNSNCVRIALQTSAFPFNRGNVANAEHLRTTGDPYNYCNTTILNYLSWAYVGWRGSIRWKIGLVDRYANDGGAMPSPSLVCIRQPEEAAADYAYATTVVTVDDTQSTNAYRILSGRNATFWDGAAITPVSNNPVVEFDIPYYSDKRFHLCRLQDRTSSSYAGTQRVPGKATFLTTNSLTTSVINVDEYVAAGDDFSLLFYIGPPILYIEENFPLPSVV